MKITSSEPRNTPKVARPLGFSVNVPPLQLPCSQGMFAPAAAGPAPPTAVQVLPRAALLRLMVSVAAPSLPLPGGERTSVRRPETSVPAPFTEVGLREATLAAQPAAELEYTCGEGDGKRHGIWRAIVHDGNAYHFYLTVPDARFGESKIIFDEMVRSFQFV